jgi:prepilin-type N-terminal cleavage/methylation domain-containing protein
MSRPRKLASRQGFTLVEMIVTLLIVGIVIAISVTFLTTGSNFLNRTEMTAADKTVAEKAANFIKGQLLYASEVEVVKSDTLPAYQEGRAILYVGDDDGAAPAHTGRLFYRSDENSAPLDVLGAAAYRNSELALAYSAIVSKDRTIRSAPATTKSAVFEAIVMVVRDGGLSQEAEQVFRMYNIGQDSEPREDGFVASWSDHEEDSQELFYLLVTPPQRGYATAGLVARFDAVDNALDSKGQPVHNYTQTMLWSDISGNGHDMDLTFTGHDSSNPPVRDNTINFDGDGDYGTIDDLGLSMYKVVTVEICFREATETMGMLFEYALSGASGGFNSSLGAFGAMSNTDGAANLKGEIHSVARVGGTNPSATSGARDFSFPANTTKLKTISFVMSNEDKDDGRLAFVNGTGGSDRTGVSFIPTRGFPTTKATTQGVGFGDYTFSVAARKSPSGLFFKGEIAAVRIYGRALNADEIEKNAAEDRSKFGL